jgi:hypothetical protein
MEALMQKKLIICERYSKIFSGASLFTVLSRYLNALNCKLSFSESILQSSSMV